jgi:hypothetical protein
MFNLANLTFINSIIRMKLSPLSTLPLFALLFLSACQNQYRQTKAPSSSASSGVVSVSGDAYQVTAQEYDQFFETRYGLLFQKFSDSPFTGRVLTVEKSADGGEYVASDESWAKGRKHGVSSRWFSNGVKMYERNYDDGKWHGVVTRWWPNGQKMYVRAYSDGLKRGKDATWRSDGTPIDLVSSGESDEPAAIDSDESPSDSGPGDLPALPGVDEPPAFPPLDSSPGDLPALPGVDEPPAFPPLDSGSGDLPPLPGGDEPAFPPFDSDSGDLPPLPGAESSDDGLPPLPAFPE